MYEASIASTVSEFRKDESMRDQSVSAPGVSSSNHLKPRATSSDDASVGVFVYVQQTVDIDIVNSEHVNNSQSEDKAASGNIVRDLALLQPQDNGGFLQCVLWYL